VVDVDYMQGCECNRVKPFLQAQNAAKGIPGPWPT